MSVERPSDGGASGVSKSISVEASRRIPAPAAEIYAVLADYHVGHPRILASAFSNLTVEQGGIGDGTVITFDMRLFGRTTRVRGVVTEPEPGRVLVESYPESGVVTTFRVKPVAAGESIVTISSEIPARHPLTQLIERWMAIRALAPVYQEELKRIESYMSSESDVRGQQRGRLGLP